MPIRSILRAILLGTGLTAASAHALAANDQFEPRIREAGQMLAMSNAAVAALDPQQRDQLIEFVIGNTLFTLAHELGHAVISEFQLPVLGREEDAADAFATPVGHLLWTLAFWRSGCLGATEWSLCASARAAEPMHRLAPGSSPALPAFAVPHKRGWLLIPASRRLLKPAPDLRGAVRMLPVQRAALEHALNRLRHVEPAAAHRRVERHDAMS